MRTARAFIVILGAAALAAGGAYYFRDREAVRSIWNHEDIQTIWRRTEELVSRHRERLPRTELTFSGNVEIRKADLAFNVSGRIESMLFEEGDPVEAGHLLATLESARYIGRVDAPRARLDGQKAVVAALEAGSRAEEIERARADVAAAKAALRPAKDTYRHRSELQQTNAVSAQALDDVREARDMTAASLRAAQQALALALKGPRDEDIEAARAELRAIEAELQLAYEDLADTEIHAPADGTILVRILEPGTIVQTGEPVYSLALRDPVWVRAYVAEPDLGLLHPGTPVKVMTDSRPDHPYQGQVGFISPTAEFTPKTVQTEALRTSLVYRFRVIVQNPDEGLRQGMPVTLTVPLKGEGARARGS